MKIVTVVGARPQFIKAAALSRKLRRRQREMLVHTGQHYDKDMSDIFFEELGLFLPDYNLEVNNGSHAEMTGRMLPALEKVLLIEQPDAVLVFGDTNSTLAGALTAVKLKIPVIHVEAGGRIGTLTNPEEVNRIVTDHLSSLRFASVRSYMENLRREGLLEHSHFAGDLMYDSYLNCSHSRAYDASPGVSALLDSTPALSEGGFVYMTCHREENTLDDSGLSNILRAVDRLGVPVIYPVHPRNRERVERIRSGLRLDRVVTVGPVGYLESLWLVDHASRVLTDSGGVQKEAFFARKPCVTVMEKVICPPTMVNGWNQLAHPDVDDILEKFGKAPGEHPGYAEFGDGNAAERICGVLDGTDFSGR